MRTVLGFLASARHSTWLRPLGLLAAAAAASAPRVALGQNYQSSVHLDQMQPATPGSPFLQAEGPTDRFSDGVAYGFGLVLDYAYEPLKLKVLPAGDVQATPVKHAFLAHVGASLSPVDWLNLELNMPFALFEGGDDASDLVLGQPMPAGKPGWGDLRIGAEFRPKVSDSVDVTFGARVWAPTGSRASYLRGFFPRARFELVAAVAGDQDMVLYGCTVGISPLWFGGHSGDRLAADCAVHVKLAPFVSLGLEPHFAVFDYPPLAKESSELPGLKDATFQIDVEPLVAARFHAEGVTVNVGVGPGFGNAPGTAGVRALIGVSYGDRGERPPEIVGIKDKDLDGVPDDEDQCPTEAGPKENHGCPLQRDKDGDGIPDRLDACPDQPGAPYDDPKGNGCPDRDNDRIPDPLDKCPDEPGPATNGGCPEHARLATGEFQMKPAVVFDRGKATLPEVAIAALKEVIGTVRANASIKSVTVLVGTKKAPANLSDERTKTILELFNDQNFDANRYEVQYDDAGENGVVKVKVHK